MFSRFSFSSIYPGGSADPICPYVRTPMCKRMLRGRKGQGGERESLLAINSYRSATSHCTIAHAGNVARNRRRETRHELDPGGTDLTVQQMLKLTHQGAASGVVSGTTVRALILCRFSQKIELKDNAKKMNKNISYYKVCDALAIWAADICSRAARYYQNRFDKNI